MLSFCLLFRSSQHYANDAYSEILKKKSLPKDLWYSGEGTLFKGEKMR